MAKKIIVLGPEKRLTANAVAEAVFDSKMKIELSEAAYKKSKRARNVIELAVKNKTRIYGVTTGFGSFKDKVIDSKDVIELQKNLIRSHAAGVGEYFSPEIIRAVLLVRLNSLAYGNSGARIEFLELLKEMFNRNVLPIVPSQGSVGSSGDLAPLSHIGLVMMGEGEAWFKGEKMSGDEALKLADLKPIEFREKEGLALNNGTAVMTAIAALAVNKSEKLAQIADGNCAMCLEAVCGTSNAFSSRIHNLRPHLGQKISAENIRNFFEGSKLIDSVKNRIQDSYSIRCAPQVHGAVRDALEYVKKTVEIELNSVTDNPLVFVNPSEVISGGNFHGEPIAIAMDTLGIAIAELADISERRTAKLLDPATNGGLPTFLIDAKKGGLHNGLMIAQYTAAALVSENKVLAHPASVDSIPTSLNQEDHVSMGTIAARKAWNILGNAENVLAIELFASAQAVEFRNLNRLGKKTKQIHKTVRKFVKYLSGDRVLANDIALTKKLFNDKKFLRLIFT